MIVDRWACPLPGGGTSDELAIRFEGAGSATLLVLPALFAEGNRMRRFTIETMRRLAALGTASVLPDLPGMNESLAALDRQDAAGWRAATAVAASRFGATHVLGLRAGCLLTPPALPAWHYAPVRGVALLRQMLRARVLSSREAGREETTEALREDARNAGIVLSGYAISARLFDDLERLEPPAHAGTIGTGEVPGAGLWLRAEPGEDAAQSEALARAISGRIAS